MRLRRGIYGNLAAQGGGGVTPTLSLSGLTVADNAAPATVIGTFSYPAEYDPATLELLWDEAAALAISGNDLVVGTTLLTAGVYQPIARIRSTATPYTYLICEPDITVTPVWSPALLTGYVGGFYSDQGVTANGSNQVTSWAMDTAAHTATQSAGATCPTLVAGYGPNGIDAIKFDSAASQFLNISPALAFNTGSIIAIYQPLDVSANKAIFGQASGRFFWQSTATSVSLNLGSTVATTPAAAATLSSNRISCLIATHDGATGTYAAEVDGVAAGGGGNAGTTAAAWTLLGKHATGSFGNYVMTALIVTSAVLTTDEKARVQAWARNRRTTAFVFANAGNDANTGFNIANAKADPIAYINGLSANGMRAGSKLLLKGGDYFYGNITAATGLNLGTASRPLTIDSYDGYASSPNVYGIAATSLTWTNVTGDEWSTPLVRVNPLPVMWADPNGSSPVKLLSQATTSPLSFQLVANVLTVNIGPGVNPNTVPVYTPKDAGDQQFFGLSGSYIVFRRLRLRYYLGQVMSPQTGTGVRAIQNEIGWCADDAISPGGTTDFRVIRNLCTFVGAERITAGGKGDGFSGHGGSCGSYSNRYIGNAASGIRNEMGTTFTSSGDYIEDSNQNLRILYNLSFLGPATQTFVGATVIRTAADEQASGLLIDANTPSNISTVVTGCTFTGLGAVRGKAMDNQGLGSLTQSGNSQTGFNSLT